MADERFLDQANLSIITKCSKICNKHKTKQVKFVSTSGLHIDKKLDKLQ